MRIAQLYSAHSTIAQLHSANSTIARLYSAHSTITHCIHIVHLQTAQLQIAQLNIEQLHIAQFHFAQLHISQLHKRVEADSAIGLQCHAIKTSPHTHTRVTMQSAWELVD